jgi:tRNA threonylcarbamoyl adenosine modification protein (Sua5/YciO/YrdC/YwlC family)
VSEVIQVDPERPEAAEQAVQAAAEAIRSSRLVVFPTETVYGLAARPDEEAATRRVFDAKRRQPGLALPVLAASADQAFGLADATDAARSVAARFWPGPLTLVLPRTEVSRPWYLGDRPDSIGVRVPDYPISAALLRATGPLATTSANVSGLPPLLDRDALVDAFDEGVAVYLVLPPGARPPGQRASTVVDLTGPDPRVVREGPIGMGALRDAMAGVQAQSTG